MGQKGCGRLEGRNSSINSPTGIGPRRQSFVSMKRDLLSSLTKGVSIGILSVLPSILFGGMVKKGRVVLTRVPSASETICCWIHVMCQNTKKLFFLSCVPSNKYSTAFQNTYPEIDRRVFRWKKASFHRRRACSGIDPQLLHHSHSSWYHVLIPC